MPAKNLVVENKPRKQIHKLSQTVRSRFQSALIEVQANPLVGEKLHGELADYRKFRLGDYRVVYRFDSQKSEVRIVKIEHRQGVYR